MKLGIIISAVIVVVFVGAIVFMNVSGTPDRPTAATSPDRLRAVTLPSDLPQVFEPTDTTADAAEVYQDAIALFMRHEAALTREDPPQPQVDELTALLVRGKDAGQVTEGFLDRYLPVEPGVQPRFGAALEWMQEIVLNEATRLHEAGQTDAAREAAMAVWALGQRAFEDNVRLYNRLQGLAIMDAAGATLYPWTEQPEAFEAWGAAIEQVRRAWDPKLGIVVSVKPHVGDLINVAQNDEDRTFRIAATLRLGIAKYAPGGEPNRRAIEEAIEDLKADPDPLVADAAHAAEALTVEEMRRIS